LTDDFNLKQKVAKEAATLLYYGAEKEFKQAKLKAAKTLGSHFLPSNLEIAFEIDKIAEENEGGKREERLIQMRKEALEVMKNLADFSPVLIGSVWRGTIKQESDVDIAAYAEDTEEVLNILKSEGVDISKTAWITVNKQGATLESFHIYAKTPSGNSLEIVLRSQEEARKKRKCETFGDELKGLTIEALQKILQTNPAQKFTPS
jgi:predicted nucleotidyltransferase